MQFRLGRETPFRHFSTEHLNMNTKSTNARHFVSTFTSERRKDDRRWNITYRWTIKTQGLAGPEWPCKPFTSSAAIVCAPPMSLDTRQNMPGARIGNSIATLSLAGGTWL